MWSLRAALMLVAIGLASSAAAQNVAQFGAFSVNRSDPRTITLNGEIGDTAVLDFRRAQAAFPQARVLLLNSLGGLVANGLLIADLAHERGFETRIPRGSRCYSACAFIFFAGMPRQADGLLGVHQIAGTANIGDAQLAVANIIEMLNRFETPDAVQAIMFRTPPDDMYIFTPQEIAVLGINRNAVAVAATPIAGTPVAPGAPAVAPAPAGTFAEARAAYDRGDYATALRIWRPLADRGDTYAQALLGFMYENGYGVAQDYAEAVRWYRLAADQGDAGGQAALGFMYYYGYGVAQDYAEAVRWYRLAAGQGDAGGQVALGFMYYYGYGVTQNYAEAVRWYRLAADQGDAGGQHALGFMYYSGRGVTQNYAEAVRWYRLAADQGDAGGQAALGFMYENGYGVTQDYAEAVRWYRLAADQGLTNAREAVLRLTSTTYTLTPADTTVNEGAGTVTFTVTRSGGLPAETLLISTSASQGFVNNGDYTALSSRALTFAAGWTVLAISVSITDDAVVEMNETFAVVVQRGGIEVARSTFTIQDDDGLHPTTYSLTPAAARVSEGAGTVTFTLTRSGGLPAETLFVSTASDQGAPNNGGDFELIGQALAFSVGQASQSILVAITNDTVVEADERFAILVLKSGATVARTTFTIQDDDPQPIAPATPAPAAGAAAEITLAAITGRWAVGLPACANETEVTVIAVTALTTANINCAVQSAALGARGLDVVVACGAPFPATETWTVTALSVVPPITAIEIAMGGDRVALVRCP